MSEPDTQSQSRKLLITAPAPLHNFDPSGSRFVTLVPFQPARDIVNCNIMKVRYLVGVDDMPTNGVLHQPLHEAPHGRTATTATAAATATTTG